MKGKSLILALGCAVLAAMTSFGRNGFCSATDSVMRQLKDLRIRQGLDVRAERIVVVVSGSIEIRDPAKDVAFLEKRDALTSQLLLEGASEIVKCIQSDFVCKKSTVSLPDKSARSNVKASSESSDISRVCQMSIVGETVLAQAEFWCDDHYEMAMAVVWSRQLERSMRAFLSGEDCKNEPGRLSLGEWLAERDLSTMSGVRQFVDKDGTRHYIGISARELNGKCDHDRLARRMSRMSASGYLTLSAYQDIQTHTECSSVAVGESLRETMRDHQSTRSGACALHGISHVMDQETVSPMTGKRIVVSVVEMSSGKFCQGSDLQKRSYTNKILLSGRRELDGSLRGIPSFQGVASFRWDGRSAEFCRLRSAAFKRAYVDALCAVADYMEGRYDCATVATLVMGDDDRAEKNISRPIASGNVKSLDEFSDLSWGYMLNKRCAMTEVDAVQSVQKDVKRQCKSSVCDKMRIIQCEEYDPKVGECRVTVSVQPGGTTKVDDVKSWIGSQNLSVVEGPRTVVDSSGHLWLLGVASIEKELAQRNGIDSIERQAACALCFALGGDISALDKEVVAFKMFADDSTEVLEQASVDRSVTVDGNVARWFQSVPKRKFVCEATHPVSNKRMQVVVYALDLTAAIQEKTK